MANSLSDPASFFSPSRLSPLSSIDTSTPSPHPQPTVLSRRNARCYVALPKLSQSIKEFYQPTPDYLGGDPQFIRSDIDAVVGEYPLDGIGKPSHYFVRFKDGLARRISSNVLLSHSGDLVDEYQHRKEQGLLDHFDPSSSDVHEYSRMNAKKSTNKVVRIPSLRASSGSSLSDPPLTEEDDDSSDDENFISHIPSRKSARLTKGHKKLVQSKLPFSPKKLRSDRARSERSESDSGNDLGGYSQVDSDVELLAPSRRSTRSRRVVRLSFSADEESDEDIYFDGPRRKIRDTGKSIKTKRAARPAYGYFRHIDDLDLDIYEDEATLRAHRGVCEKCRRLPAHELLKRSAKSRHRIKGDKDESENDEDDIRGYGGWVRCLKCPVVAHWRCLAKTQKDEITRAARARDDDQSRAPGEDASKPSTGGSTDRRELDIDQTTEFVCGLCMKGGICMGCLEVALRPDPAIINRLPFTSSHESGQDGMPDIEMVNETSLPSNDSSLQPSKELLFRCISCKRVAHYQHLPNPENAVWADADLASYYQKETEWRCADCASYVYALDKILAWRPYPPDFVETPSISPPDPKSLLPREYLVKWMDRSYRRTQWVPHLWLVSTHLSKLKHFLTKGTKVPLLEEPLPDEMAMDPDRMDGKSKESIVFEPGISVSHENTPPTERIHVSLGPLPDAERRIPPAWKTIDRVLDVRFWNPSGLDRKRRKKHVVNDEIGEVPRKSRQQLERAYVEGEQPDESFMEELNDWLSRTKEKLSMEHIDDVVWIFVKWGDLGYEEATWDSPPRRGEQGYSSYQRAFQYFIDSRKVRVKKTRKEIDQIDARAENGYGDFALKRDLDQQPDLGQSDQLKMMEFQIDGYNWLCDNWWNRQPSILADEMGLGKTVQIVTFLGTVVEKFCAAPVLVVVPNSTITNWVREFTRWAPRLKVVPFFGEAKSRDVVIRYELFHEPKHEPRYHVLITTYETVTNPRDFATVFKSVSRWEILVVDEGQRLKSDNSLLFKKLNELKPIHRIIMTGTPLNNNIRELFNLMNFLDSDKWQDLEALEKEYEELNEDLVRQLHIRLKPYFLRRIKSEVLQLPPKNEVIVPLSLTPLQKEIYRSILSQNLDILKHLTQVTTIETNRSEISKTNMNNMLMQLRKCIQHPYLISDDIEPRNLEPHEAHEKLVSASAKLRLLRALLPKLKARGHRVLLFSQFVIALDIIEDFLEGENYKYLRLDGETKQATRQRGMDDFNKPDSEYFIYLLTTRAGGVGINLYTADTVIIYDPDFNPHQDLQAIARSHRYGQEKTCLVFKLMVKDSAEERIMQAGKRKLVLDHLIVQKMDDDENGGDDLSSILTFGARALFEEGEQGSKDIVYTDHDLDKLIERTEVKGDEDATSDSGLKFNFAKVWAAEKDALEDIRDAVPDIDQGDSWAQALEHIAARVDATKEKEVTGRGVRRKAAAAFPQQQLDFLGDFEDTPPKGKGKGRKKGRSLNPEISSDSDVYDGSAHQGGDDTDATTESMDLDQELPSVPVLHKKQSRNQVTPLPTIPTSLAIQNRNDPCGLCGRNHGPGACYMMNSTSNLMEYREMLLNHTVDEPWESRKAAIDAIERALYERGQGHLLVGQALKLISGSGSSSKPAKTNNEIALTLKNRNHSISSQMPMHEMTGISLQSAVQKDDHAMPPKTPPHKRTSSPGGLLENSSKKQKQNGFSGCPVCFGSHHLLEDCPVLRQDTPSVRKHILRLSEDPSQVQIARQLQFLLQQRKQGT